MSLLEIILIALSLSLDAAVVAVSAGAMNTVSLRKALMIALTFGMFQAIMPLIGWLGGSLFAASLASYGNIVGFILILLVGLNMLKESLGSEDDEVRDIFRTGTLIALAVATSIDALVVGITFNFIPVSIPLAVAVIGVVTFLMSFAGVYIGKRGSSLIGSKAELLGALVLILLSFKVLLS